MSHRPDPKTNQELLLFICFLHLIVNCFRSDPINQKVYFGDFGPSRVRQEQEAARDSGWGYTLIDTFLLVQNI